MNVSKIKYGRHMRESFKGVSHNEQCNIYRYIIITQEIDNNDDNSGLV